MNKKLKALRNILWEAAALAETSLEDLRSLCLGVAVRAGMMEGFSEEETIVAVTEGVRMAYQAAKDGEIPPANQPSVSVSPPDAAEGLVKVSVNFHEMIAKAKALRRVVKGWSRVEILGAYCLLLIDIEDAETSAERMAEVSCSNVPTMRKQLRAVQADAINQRPKN